MTQLPAGWEWSTVGEVGEYVNGRGFKKSEWSNTGRPIIRIQNLTGSGSEFNYFAGELEDRYVVPPGALLVSWAATLGVYRWDGPEGALNQHIFRVRSFINENFHRYLLEHVLDLMQSHTHGSGMVHITRGRFDETPAPLPPLAEQERIVAAVEEAFSKLEAGEAGLRTVRQLLKRMRDAILAAAFAGRLVAQDPTDTPAMKLLADLGIEEVPRSALELPSTWAVVRLGDVLAEPLANGRSVRSRDGGFPVLRLTCLDGGRVDLSERKDGEWDSKAAAPFLVRKGDFLVSRGNGSLALVGRGGLVLDEPDPVAYPDTLIRVRVPERVMAPALLALVWNSAVVRRQLEAQARTTAGIYKVNQSMLSDLELPLPPREEQPRIVAEVERQLSSIAACERAVDAALPHSAAMRRSVLKAAFEGQLVPRGPTDEPASALLERIRAEQAAAPKAKSRRAGAKP